jgi:hypothetical protein
MINLVPDYNHWYICPKCNHQTPLYVKEWVGLTDEEKLTIVRETDNPVDALAATEAKLKEKNA